MKWLVAVGLVVALGTVIFIAMSRSQGARGGSGEAGKGGDKRPVVQDRNGWRTYHGNAALDGVAGGVVPDAPELLWKYKAGNRVDLTPVSADGKIYFTTAKGGLVALDLEGRELWKIAIASESFSSPPLLAGDRLVVGTGKGFLRAFDIGTGKDLWSYDIGGTVQGSPNLIQLPDGRAGVVAISQADGSLQGVDLATGKSAWKAPGGERCDGSPSVHDGRIVMGSCASALHVYSEKKGEKIMDVPLGNDNQVAGGVALSGTSAFAGTRSGKLCAVDVAGGKILWTNTDGQGEAFMTPAVNATTAVFGADDGKVYAVKRDTGAKIWAFDTGNRPMSPVIAGDRVVVTSGGTLFLLALADGIKLWSAPVADDITSPAVVSGRIYVGGDDGTLSAYGKK